jgi:hypothetical protein
MSWLDAFGISKEDFESDKEVVILKPLGFCSWHGGKPWEEKEK